MAKKRIMFFINTLACGGAEKVLVDLVNGIDDMYDVTVVSVLGGAHENSFSEKINYRKIVRTNNRFLRRILSGIAFKLPYSIFNLLFLRNTYDLEIAYLGGFCTRVIANRKNKSKKIAFVHTDVSVSDKYKRLYRKDNDCISEYKRFDRVCFVSEVAKTGFEKKYGKLDNACIIHNVINVNDIRVKSEIENEYEYHTTGLKIVTVGRLSSEKGYDRLISIAAALENKYEFEMFILGEGPERQRLEDIISENNVRSVKLLGFQENPYSFLKKADLYVCSSFFEGYSTSVTEASILGIPVLTTDCAGMNEILDNNINGIIVENKDMALSDMLEKLLVDSALYSTIKSGAVFKSQTYSNNYALKEYYELFSSIIK